MEPERPADPGRKPSHGVLSPVTIVAAVLMLGVGFGGAWVVDRYLLPRFADDEADGAVVAPAPDVVPLADAAANTPATGDSTAPDEEPLPPDVTADGASATEAPGGDDVPPATIDGALVALGEFVLPEYQFRSRREGDPQKVFSWSEVTVDLEGVVGDVVLELDLKNCPNDTDGRLVSPSGTMILLWSERGDTRDWDQMQGAFPDTLVPLESLCPLRGEAVRGAWRLRVGDSRQPCNALLREARLLFQPPTRPCPAAE